MQSGR